MSKPAVVLGWACERLLESQGLGATRKDHVVSLLAPAIRKIPSCSLSKLTARAEKVWQSTELMPFKI